MSQGLRLVLSDQARLARGFEALLARSDGFEGVHFGLVDSGGHLVQCGTMANDGDTPATAVLGRHSCTDLRGEDRALSLRHVLLVRPRGDGEMLHVFDLKGGGGTQTLDGRSVGAMMIDLPAALRIGPYVFVAFDSRARSLGARGLAELSGTALVRDACATATSGLFFVLEDVERVVSVSEDSAQYTMPIAPRERLARQRIVIRPSPEGLARGVLLGRYPRCGAPGTVDWDDTMSRVHAALFAVDERVYIADLGSTHGTVHDTLGTLRLKHVTAGDTFWLGRTRLTVEPAI